MKDAIGQLAGEQDKAHTELTEYLHEAVEK